MKRKGTPPVRTPRYAVLQSTSTWNSDTCAYVSTLLTSRGTQVLCVVNSVELHLNESCNEVSYLQFVCICLSVVALESHSFSVDDTITMRLMKRAKVW